MAFQATHLEQNTVSPAVQGPAKTLFVLTLGVVVGLMLSGMSGSESFDSRALSTGEIIGEDWHGNVRRSSPMR